ncbi:hypothetical protein NFB50_01785 [Yersinia ruckeri]|uniref:hypothetical protein n=2 Tax=Yersinia ruckeri TaxID=29486 RepID=UPI000AB11589|nr:hypothetical protein [Yersinia ruckeri]MCW6521585.1 hypothetical protein [Yersinia ruckeri]MCW6557241.1 hypothetical protein [Yersinia ruckeri]MCW6578962.1 hypothetical protein [Yersinia ruckeri]MCW6596680.1 hypothetical protein [Yersinia ruckeri]MCW6622782.1 hypothetical protein [Yersinia ruckeri]
MARTKTAMTTFQSKKTTVMVAPNKPLLLALALIAICSVTTSIDLSPAVHSFGIGIKNSDFTTHHMTGNANLLHTNNTENISEPYNTAY